MRAQEFIIERKKRSKKTRSLGGYFFPGYGFYGGDAGDGGGDGGGGGESKNLGVAQGKIKLYTDPDYFGAEVNDYQASGPVRNIPVDLLVGFEPDSKMAQPESRANVKKIIAGIKRGDDIPPILVRDYKDGYQILDGHHRFRAYKLLGVKSIPAQIVSDSDIEEISKQGVAEALQHISVNETINPDILNRRFRHTQTIGDYTYKASVEIFLDELLLNIKAYDGSKEIGHAMFEIFHWEDKPTKSHIESGGTEVEPAYQNKGVASTMYAYAKMLGNDIRASSNRTDQGKTMWSAWEKSGGAKHLTGQVAENFADGKVKGKSRPGRVKRAGASCDGSVTDLRARAKKASGERARMYHWCANMKSGRKKTNEVTVGVLTLGEFTVNIDDHALDRAQERRIKSTDIDTVLKKIKLPRVIKKIMAIDLGSRFYVLDHSSNVALGFRRIGDKKLVLKTVYPGRPMDHNIATIITI
jgi:hypothetical protein